MMMRGEATISPALQQQRQEREAKMAVSVRQSNRLSSRRRTRSGLLQGAVQQPLFERFAECRRSANRRSGSASIACASARPNHRGTSGRDRASGQASQRPKGKSPPLNRRYKVTPSENTSERGPAITPLNNSGRHIARGAAELIALRAVNAGEEGQTEIEQPQIAVAQQNDIFRLDVAVNDLQPQQILDRPTQFEADADALGEPDRRLGQQALFERLSGIIRHDQVKAAAALRRKIDIADGPRLRTSRQSTPRAENPARKT